MKELTRQCFCQVEVVGSLVFDENFGLIGSEEAIILPSLRENTIKQGAAVIMHLWPMDKSLVEDHPHFGRRPQGPASHEKVSSKTHLL